MPRDSDFRAVLALQTDGEWFVDDLKQLCDATEQIYGATFGISVIREHLETTFRRTYGLGMEPDDPSTAFRLRTDPRYLPRIVPLGPAADSAALDYLYSNKFAIHPGARLTVSRIQMASPGWAIFSSSKGKNIEQAREVVRDVAFQLAEDKEASNIRRAALRRESLIDAMKDLRSLEQDFGPLPPQLKEQMLRESLGGAEAYEELMDKGLLRNDPEHLDGSGIPQLSGGESSRRRDQRSR